MPTKKLGLVLLPFLPLSAIGIVEVASAITRPDAAIEVDHCELRRVDDHVRPEPPATPPAE